LKVSTDGQLITFSTEEPARAISTYFNGPDDVDSMYEAVNWGTVQRVIDIRSGLDAPSSSGAFAAPPTGSRTVRTTQPPRADARRLSVAPSGNAELFVANAADGTRLWLCGSAETSARSCDQIWAANQWMGDIQFGPVQSISYKSQDGEDLTGWVLLPPDFKPGTRLPVVTIVYPGEVYGAAAPPSFSLYRADFLHPQLFAALGYCVLLPSMPRPKEPTAFQSVSSLTTGVLPAVDAIIARGIADPERIAVVGNSAGGFAVMGLVTQTTRFRSAIASAGYSDATSLYGTFYGQYRYGDGGPPERAQILRMLQLEKGFMGFQSPPWQAPDLYYRASPVLQAGKVRTPVMLVHGDLDFVPVQQAEEFFTSLYRQDLRSVFLRYQGEGHGISNRENVLDLWTRLRDWLHETMPPGQ
jgi:dipeptidyl aminopeptidase/acylaminoacyl peptidase